MSLLSHAVSDHRVDLGQPAPRSLPGSSASPPYQPVPPRLVYKSVYRTGSRSAVSSPICWGCKLLRTSSSRTSGAAGRLGPSSQLARYATSRGRGRLSGTLLYFLAVRSAALAARITAVPIVQAGSMSVIDPRRTALRGAELQPKLQSSSYLSDACGFPTLSAAANAYSPVTRVLRRVTAVVCGLQRGLPGR